VISAIIPGKCPCVLQMADRWLAFEVLFSGYLSRKVKKLKDMKKGYNIVQNIIHLLGMVYKHYKIVFLFILLEMFCNGLLPLFGLYLPKLAVELVLENQGLNHALFTLGGFAIIYVLLQCINSVASQGKYPFQNAMRHVYTELCFYKTFECDYTMMESSTGQTWYEKARSVLEGGGSAPTQMLNSVASLISGLISFVFIFGIISNLSLYILALLVLLSAANYFLDSFALRYEKSQRDATADLRKKTSYMERSMSDIGAAKDIRIYHFPLLFSSINQSLLRRMFIIYKKIQNRYFLSGSLKMLITLCRDGVAYAYCIKQVINGIITVPNFILYMGAIASFSAWMNGIVSNVLTLKRENPRMNDLRTFFEYINKFDPEKPFPISAIMHPIEIEFKNVSFQYTDDTPKILDQLSFHIHANEKVALVGVNGAGKTTIVKLLCGFYKTTEGEILINGYNINLFKRADLYTLFSAVFQEICILPLTVGENITFGDVNESDEKKLLQCLEIAGIKDEIMKTDKKLATPMLKAIDENGIILSGGQQQKLLLARALYKDAPILILDEPTAALDPIAESEVYEKFHEVTKNKTAIYISHRLASTRFCDTIFMLKGGRIIESGSHKDLIAKNGEYAYMYNIQSHYYKQEDKSVWKTTR
jgi:ABC-type multidrug transport system fused ATPase/permease subunit